MADSALLFVWHLLLYVLSAFLSYLLNYPINGQHLRIGRLSLAAAYDISYEGTLYDKAYSFKYTTASISWRFFFPRSDNPRWLTITARDILYTSSSGDISTTTLETVLWFFPFLFRFTAGPWANVSVDGLRIRVQKSTATPYWIQVMRETLVSTFLTGEFLRADVFRTTVRFAGLSEHPDDKPAATMTTNPAGPLRPQDEDEVRFGALARRVHINDTQGRICTFGSIDAQLRRNWAADRGSFAMVAEECRWVRVHFPFECVAARGWYAQMLTSLLHFPIDLVRTFNDPSSSINLYVSRLDVTFDSFRIRDAELVRQAFVLAREKTITSNIAWNDVFFDALADALSLR
ncbi:uncharacterized protein TRAVEDRAFT_110902 [Trametes versicolor FP-101664 SS1]|uniref:uncharacterized protein n=1 Tax=Trametes versicolor (strain FP-101664) TaxID=717944 RepID=UPI0004623126|nr:uncharacterized protein TRAVEDRAFT_110902 [Trametes versicolor FP-101664 SS1]EIW63748.1 hypothetical protein TRAVEDRAFT_110902 [Trametes versicolor FP-101664 SS1]